jgi:ATP-dependent DNA helicase RecG
MQPSIDKLQKFLKLEAERGYDNRAVVGGLEKILPIWEAEARVEEISEETIQKAKELIQTYTANTETRAETFKEIWNLLAANGGTHTMPTPVERPKREEYHPKQTIQIDRHDFHTRGTRPDAPSMPAAAAPRQYNGGPKVGLSAPLTTIQGIGPRHAETLNGLGLNTLEDLMYYFPRRYDDFSQLKPINHLFFGEEITVIGAIQSVNTRPVKGGSFHIIEAVITDGTGSMRLTWFNQLWIANRLKPGMQIVISGKVDQYLGRLVMNNPEWEQLELEQLHTNRIVPVYPLIASITQKWLRRMMHQTVTYWASQVEDFLPGSIKASYKLYDLGQALREIHFPSSQETLAAARKRLAFDEMLLLQLGKTRQKREWKSASATPFRAEDSDVEKWSTHLPYELTNAQKNAIAAIREDLQSGQPMNRLLQGDVGSGKTIVAALGLAVVIHGGGQGAIMAPTSILAEQHYRNLTNLLANPENPDALLKPEEIELLIGSTKESDKDRIKAGLADGTIKLAIGTHALIEDPVVFKDLQMVVVDEQHRFGVDQRAALRSKGTNPHLLVMTATPIPRSLALTLHGDLDLTVMDEMPAGRQYIETLLLYPREREMAYTRIQSQVEAGRQAFIIYPLVEQGDNDEAKAAVEEHERLQREVFHNLKVGLLHGRMKPDEKDQVMTQFRDRQLDVLVSTSVVEVGVDVPNATVMVIEGANRFGLSQLHQFRGRVGRGEFKSFCLLIPESENDSENERLKAMVETNDGFVLAEKDLEQRGPGDFLGTRQSGMADLRLASLTDIRLIEKAREAAEKLLAEDPDLGLPEHQPIVSTLQRFWGTGRGDIS